jgi:hypothetical protein
MFNRIRFPGAPWLAAMGLLAMGLVSAAPASAQQVATSCDQSNESLGLAVEPAGTKVTVTAQADGTFTGSLFIRVYCWDFVNDVDLGNVPNAQVSITTSALRTTFDGEPATDTQGALINLPTGSASIPVVTTDPALSGLAFGQIGFNTVVDTMAFGTPVSTSDQFTWTGKIFAQTPELDSLVLFGSGGASLAGYLLLRRRSRRS